METRFLTWLFQKRAIDKRASLVLLVGFALQIWGRIPQNIILLLCSGGLLCVSALYEKNPLRVAKKPLVLTHRAWRILSVCSSLLLILGWIFYFITDDLWIWILFVQLIPFSLAAANFLLSPFESWRQRTFWREAKAVRARLNPTVIGITASFGKTSIKHILGHLLSHQAQTLITPGSVNTPMGVARSLREKLKADHKFFVCEMGAYQPGSIARLCRLTTPDVGIIGALGHAHYERFRSLDRVAQAKFELAEAVVARGGHMVIADEVSRLDYADAFVRKHRAHITLVGSHPESDVCLRAVVQKLEGIEVTVCVQGQEIRLKAPLFGAHHGLNLALSFALARHLDIPEEDIRLSMNSLPQITHRLEVSRRSNDGVVMIDDSYNANPAGFSAALDVLEMLGADQQKKYGKTRRILISPGMVELGKSHDAQHARIGEKAAHILDIFLPVCPERIPTLIAPFQKEGISCEIIPCASFAAAQNWMRAHLQAGDVVLIENDLPDVYEASVRF